MNRSSFVPLLAAGLATGIRSRQVRGINGLDVHVLEAGFEQRGRPLLLLLHGFPELAYSWRKIMLPLAAAGFHVVAPDQRGYGRTTGWDPRYDGDVASFRVMNIVRDAFGLVAALGYREVSCLVGHDFGSPVAAFAAVVRPDLVRRVVLMSAPFGGIPSLPFDTANQPPAPQRPSLHEELAALSPPRKHYQWYYSEPGAEADMLKPPQGLSAFLRAYYHVKSADWSKNQPYPLASWTAGELAKLPTYYVMERDKGMAATVAPDMPSAEQIARCQWLTDAELAVYAGEFARTGLQGGLNWYRCRTTPGLSSDTDVFAGRTIDVPSCFVAGASDWGIHQVPGALESMSGRSCTRFQGVQLIEGAGHWVQQERPEATAAAISSFIRSTGG